MLNENLLQNKVCYKINFNAKKTNMCKHFVRIVDAYLLVK